MVNQPWLSSLPRRQFSSTAAVLQSLCDKHDAVLPHANVYAQIFLSSIVVQYVRCILNLNDRVIILIVDIVFVDGNSNHKKKSCHYSDTDDFHFNLFVRPRNKGW